MSTPAATTTPPPPSPAGGAAAPASPPWADTYLRALSEHRQKALAALAAGQELPVIVRQRHTNPCFAQREAEILETLADVLESEAIRRVTARAPIKKVGSDAFLLRLLEIFHPRWTAREKGTLARLAPSHCTPNGPIRARRKFEFATRRQRTDFQKWEREQAIALALSSFYEGFQNLPVTSYSLSAQYRDLTGATLGQLPPRAPSPWSPPSPSPLPPAQTTLTPTPPEPNPLSVASAGRPQAAQPNLHLHSNAPSPAPVASAGFERSENDCRRQPEGCERQRASTPQAPEPNPQPNSKPTPTSTPKDAAPAPTSTPTEKSPAHQNPPSAAPQETPTHPPGSRRRFLYGLAMPPGSKTGVSIYPGFIPHLIRTGSIKPPGHTKHPPSPGPLPDSS